MSVSYSKAKAEPGDPINIEVTADATSFVGLLAVDQSVLLLAQGNDITQQDVSMPQKYKNKNNNDSESNNNNNNNDNNNNNNSESNNKTILTTVKKNSKTNNNIPTIMILYPRGNLAEASFLGIVISCCRVPYFIYL